jgi:hypothetical protein
MVTCGTPSVPSPPSLPPSPKGHCNILANTVTPFPPNPEMQFQGSS